MIWSLLVIACCVIVALLSLFGFIVLVSLWLLDSGRIENLYINGHRVLKRQEQR